MEVLNFNPNEGVKEYQVGKDNPDAVIRLNLGDSLLPNRLIEAIDNVDKFMNEVNKEKNVHTVEDLDNMKIEDVEKDLALNKEADVYIREQINTALNADVADTIFGGASCMTLTPSGVHMFESFFNVLVPAVEKEFNVRIAKAKKRVLKYTNQKGTHPALRK